MHWEHAFASLCPPRLHFTRSRWQRGRPLDPGIFTVGVAAVVAVALAAVQIVRRRRRALVAAEALRAHAKRPARIPLTLHPVIDPDVCIGSLTCLKACPEGDILGIVDNAARLLHPEHCIGHGKCAAECPVDAIKLVFGTRERGIDLPMIDEFFESSRAGVHVVGELGGMGLIRNAVTQGLQVSQRLAETLPKNAANDTSDVVVVGAGPAGLATALGLRSAGRSFRVVEQGSLGGTIANYPRQKLVMTEPVQLPYLGKLKQRQISKEDLLAAFSKALGKAGVTVEEGVRVQGIDGKDGAFEVLTSKGPIRARKVVLATGLRGSPRKLGVPGEELDKVTYRLIDPEQYEGCRVLVVGGGDSALEAAIQIANETDAEVALSYRAESFSRVRDANREKIAALGASGRVRLLMNSQVEKITANEVVVTHAGSPVVLPNDFVIVSIGGDLPLEFLAKAGVDVQRHFEQERAAPQKQLADSRRGLARERTHSRERRTIHALYLTTGALILAWLTLKGYDYYLLPRAARMHSPLHGTLRAAGHWGHGVGIVATGFMMLNFVYPLRKRARALSGVGSIRDWLDFHMFVGFMSPLVIAFHAAFQSNNQLATATAAALLVVVFTGIVGRFIYGLVPTSGGRAVELADLRGAWERLRARLQPLIEDSDDPALLHALFDGAGALPAQEKPLPLVFLMLPARWATARMNLLRARTHFREPAEYAEFTDGYQRLERLRVQLAFFQGLKTLLRTWRLFHASLAVFLVITISAHIAVSLYLGYGWKR